MNFNFITAVRNLFAGRAPSLGGASPSGGPFAHTAAPNQANMLAHNTTSQRSPDPAAPALNQRVEGTTHMSHAYISLSQAAAIRQGRQGSDADRKAIKKEVFDAVRAGYGIPSNIKFRVEVDPAQPGFRLLKDKTTGQPIRVGDDGKYAADQGTPASNMVWVRMSHADTANVLRDYLKDVDVDGGDVTENVYSGAPTFADSLIVDGDATYVRVSRDDLSID